MRDLELYIPVGIVASGKSTACRKWAAESEAVIVEADVFRTIFHRKYTYDPKTEDIIWKVMQVSTAEWLNHKVCVAVDDAVLFLKKKNRTMFELQLKCMTMYPYRVIWDFLPLPTDEQVAERRGREGRGYSVEEWLEVAQRQREEMEGPDL
jgi:hypothetical protein